MIKTLSNHNTENMTSGDFNQVLIMKAGEDSKTFHKEFSFFMKELIRQGIPHKVTSEYRKSLEFNPQENEDQTVFDHEIVRVHACRDSFKYFKFDYTRFHKAQMSKVAEPEDYVLFTARFPDKNIWISGKTDMRQSWPLKFAESFGYKKACELVEKYAGKQINLPSYLI